MSSKYAIKEVITAKDERLWLDFPARLYKDDAHYVRPMDSQIKGIFDPKQNKLFRHGCAVRYLLTDIQGHIAGRIAVFIDPKTAHAKDNEQPTGGCGFFDCIDDQDAADMLFDAAKKWLSEHGMEAMDGPVNFGDRDYFWGCLVDGFHDPVFNMPYNFPYYQKLFENYGFREYFKQFTFHREIVPGGLDPILYEKLKRIGPGYTFEIIDKKKIDKYADDFLTVYNKAWGVIPGVAKITRQHAIALLNSLKPVIDPRLMHFVYYNGEPVAFFLMMIDLNQIYKGLNGKDHFLNKLRIFWRIKVSKKCDRVTSLAFGVVPEHRARCLEAGLICAFEKLALRRDFKYKDLQINWIGDFNPPMIKIAKSVGATLYKTHITYRYLFDRNKPFVRAKLQK